MAIILVANKSGNVGKSTLTNHMLVPRIPNAKVINVESINNSGESTGEKLSAHEFQKIFDIIFSSEGNVIVDVGSSNIEMFLDTLTVEYEGAINFFDYIIIPIVSDEKQQIDSLGTATSFKLMGYPEEKIKFVLNRCNMKRNTEEQFNLFFAKTGLKPTEVSTVREVNLFKSLKEKGMTYKSLAEDNRDLDKLIKECKNPKERAVLFTAKLFKQGYDSYHKDLDTAFSDLNLEIE